MPETPGNPTQGFECGRQAITRFMNTAHEVGTNEILPPCGWSSRTALDPKHKPQVPYLPSTTVRREWARYPQEAHLLEPGARRIRRLRPAEIVRLQGFDPEWFRVSGAGELDWVRAAGDAVPPPLAEALFTALAEGTRELQRTHIEIAAGAGGLASGCRAAGFETLALVDAWPTAGGILKAHWDPSLVHVRDVRRFDLDAFRGEVGVLSGGPPCQPWSSGGVREGERDPRDLMGQVDTYIAKVEPQAFVWENVPGLLRGEFVGYFQDLVRRLREPASHLRYGVLGAILNAADFGVPQVRRRLFIIGLRERPASDVLRIFDSVHAAAARRGANWRNVSEVLDPDAEGWMRWWYQGFPNGITRTRKR